MDAAVDLLDVDVQALTFRQQLDHASALEQLSAKVAAASVRTFAAIEAGGLPGADPSFKGKQLVREEVACQLTISPWMAASRLNDAAAIVAKLPGMLGLLETGRTSYWHARALLDGIDGMTEEVIAQVVDRVLGLVITQTVTEFSQSVKRAAASIDPKTFEERHKKAAAKRGVWLRPAADGMGWVNTCTTISDATALYTALTSIATTPHPVADGDQPDPRGANERRADALVDLVLAAEKAAEDSGQRMPERHGRRPSVQVSVALSTLTGLDIQPAELIGYGPIPASLALQIAFDQTGTWRRLITDGTGRALDFPVTSYRPPTDLREFVLTRDFTCRAPGCNRLARTCDIDHHHDHAHGGETSSTNCGPLCDRSHQVKHEAGWHVHRTEDGITHWRSITGRTFQKPPDRHPIDRTMTAPAAQQSPRSDDPPF